MTITRAYILLLVLLALTFGVSFVDLGHGNDIIAWVISLAKTLLILSVFMKYRRELPDSRIYFLLGILTILLLLIGILDDVLFRPPS